MTKNEDPDLAISPLEGHTEEEAQDLLEIAYLYFAQKSHEATRSFNALSQALKTRCYEHLETIGGNPYDLHIHALKWQQALIRSAFEISGEGTETRFLSTKEIATLFQERHALS